PGSEQIRYETAIARESVRRAASAGCLGRLRLRAKACRRNSLSRRAAPVASAQCRYVYGIAHRLRPQRISEFAWRRCSGADRRRLKSVPVAMNAHRFAGGWFQELPAVANDVKLCSRAKVR